MDPRSVVTTAQRRSAERTLLEEVDTAFSSRVHSRMSTPASTAVLSCMGMVKKQCHTYANLVFPMKCFSVSSSTFALP